MHKTVNQSLPSTTLRAEIKKRLPEYISRPTPSTGNRFKRNYSSSKNLPMPRVKSSHTKKYDKRNMRKLALLLDLDGKEISLITSVSKSGMDAKDIYVYSYSGHDKSKILKLIPANNILNSNVKTKELALSRGVKRFKIEKHYKWVYIAGSKQVFTKNYFRIYKRNLSPEYIAMVDKKSAPRVSGAKLLHKISRGSITLRTDILNNLKFVAKKNGKNLRVESETKRGRLGKVKFLSKSDMKNPIPKNKKSRKKYKGLPNTKVKVNGFKHLLPPVVGILVTVLIFLTLNSQNLASKLAYRYVPAATPVVAAKDRQTVESQIDPNAKPQLMINKIDVTAPVIFDIGIVDEGLFQKALQSGVVHYPGTGIPGESDNVVVFGHSSGQIWAPGDYKFIFTHLDKLVKKDKIFLEYKGLRYTYQVVRSYVVLPTNLSPLQPSKTPQLTLITCTPVGTSEKRLVVIAEQIDPEPASKIREDDTSNSQSTVQAPQALPSNTPSFWQAVRDLF